MENLTTLPPDINTHWSAIAPLLTIRNDEDYARVIIGVLNMNTKDLLNRITFNKNVLAGKPLIRGLRISVEMVLELLAKGATIEEILEDYPDLETEDIQAALFYAYHLVSQEEIIEIIATS